MEKNKKQKNLLQVYSFYIAIPAFTVAAIIISAVVLLIIYAHTQAIGLMIALLVISLLTLGAYIVFYFRVSKKIHRTYYEQLYKTTITNINKIRDNDVNLTPYGDSEIKEIQMLDKATSDIRSKLESSFLLLKDPSYDHITLEYVDKEKNLITYKSFKDNLSNIIFVSQSFRNVIIEVYFNLPSEVTLSKKEKRRLLDIYTEAFQEHAHSLYCFADDDKSLLIYVPSVDSFSEIKEKLNYVVTNSSIMVRDDKGIRNVLAQYAVVAYPYSNEDMLLGDLRYAKSLNKPYFLFLPTRYKSNLDKKLIMSTTMNLNYMSKVMGALGELDYSAADNERNKKILRATFDAIADFMDIDEAGIVAYDEYSKNFYSYVNSKRSTLFTHDVRSKFIDSLSKAVDDDGTYYFSTRKHANYAIEREIDLYGITSGIYYVIRDFENVNVIAIVYLFNRGKDLVLNSYLRETFYMVSLRIENYFDKRDIADYADSKSTENDNILALSNMFIYHCDEDFRFTFVSKALKRKFPDLKIGEYCYKRFFDKDKPCKDCPIRTGVKKYFTDRGAPFETSLILADRKDKNKVVLIRQLEETEEFGDMYQKDLLVYSFKSLTDLVKNEFAAAARGYLLLLSVDNYEDIVKEKGSEGYSYYARELIRSIKYRLQINDVYFYNPSTIAIHFPYIGHADLINKIESIYPLTKNNFYKSTEFGEFKITYLPVGYPRGYANPQDYLKHVSDFYRDPKFERNKDYIYFADFSISRSANKRVFMVNVLEQEFSGHNSTSMYLQPIVSVKDGHIFGAEILLRIADAHRNVFFNAMEISQIAEEEHKTELVTESIINFIGNMYKEHGKSIFKINKFNRVAINIDQTYLDDKSLLTKLIKLSEENNLPSGFISMEIPEDLIPNNKVKIKELADRLSKYHIMFSCDRYMGQYVDIEELRNLGFNEVKVARDIILTIDKDPVKYDEMKKIVTMSKKNNIAVAAVGVENEKQLKMLKQLDEDMMVQGYFLYKPLSKSDLIAALISYEK